MINNKPLYTEQRECQDCYKCVRHCPVKAITVQDGSALVSHELCIYCGKCYEICPVGAKKVPNEIHRVEQLIKIKEKTCISLSPSFFSEFSGQENEIFQFFYKKGILALSETAIAAEYVSREIENELQRHPSRNLISTACPSVVSLINLYYPNLRENMTSVASPMIVHGRYLKEKYGNETGVIFIGPCIAKKGEARESEIDAVLTFEELRLWMERYPSTQEGETPLPEDFFEALSEKASLYPMDGGMIASLTTRSDSVIYEHISGLDRIMGTLKEIEQEKKERGVFFELLACSGGCINGPARGSEISYFKKKADLLDRLTRKKGPLPEKKIDVYHDYRQERTIEREEYSIEQIESVLIGMDKRSLEDRLNCGGCGYNSCHDFAIARLQGKAEIEMCAGNMRKQAQQKVNALIKTIPAGVVIVDQNHQIVECNSRFLHFFSDTDVTDFEDVASQVKGVPVENFGRFSIQFEDVLLCLGERNERIKKGGAVYKSTFFTIEKNFLAGAIFQDVTQPTIRRSTIIKKADEVIRKNLESVQQIASLLGENAAETEIILNSVIEELIPPRELSEQERER